MRSSVVAVVLVCIQSIYSLQLSSLDLRRGLFGGHPHLIFCSEKVPNKKLDAFIRRVQELSQPKIKVAEAKCGDLLGTTSLQKKYNLKRLAKGMPVILWAVNGSPPIQLALSKYTSNSKLDHEKLAKYATAKSKPSIISFTSNQHFASECLNKKYQLCGVVVTKSDSLSAEQQSIIKSAVETHRHVRWFVLDSSKFNIASSDGFTIDTSRQTDASLMIVRNKHYVHEGEIVPKSTKADPHPMGSITWLPGERMKVSQSIKNISSAKDPKTRIKIFKKGLIDSSTKVILTDNKGGQLALLIKSEDDQGYIMDIHSANEIVYRMLAFNATMSSRRLAKLQSESLSRHNPNRRASKTDGSYIYTSGFGTAKGIESALKSSLDKSSSVFLPYSNKLMLSNIVLRKKKKKEVETDKDRELKRIIEMEEEGRESYAMPNDEFESNDEEEENANQNDISFGEEISLDDECET